MSVDIVCFSHLAWDWVWQRPQQILTRLAAHDRVLYIEEPRIQIGAIGSELTLDAVHSGVTRARFVSSSSDSLFRRRLCHQLRILGLPFDEAFAAQGKATVSFESGGRAFAQAVATAVRQWRRTCPLVAYVYTPLAIRLLDVINPDVIIYDAMDELSAFAFAHPALSTREGQLLEQAELVLAGSPSLFREKVGRNPEVHLICSGVERRDFEVTALTSSEFGSELRDVRRPIIGFYGVLDERTDLGLLSAMSEARSDWTFAMIGPVLKIDPSSLPRRSNILYLGFKPYAQLRNYLAQFDVAMIPFARNRATRDLRPTKLLEYLAAGKPVVSTPLRDIVDGFSSCVRFGEDPSTFTSQVQAALAETDQERRDRQRHSEKLLASYSWDSIAKRVRALMLARLAMKKGARTRRTISAPPEVP
jgi:UDP-galactopyranose mutase